MLAPEIGDHPPLRLAGRREVERVQETLALPDAGHEPHRGVGRGQDEFDGEGFAHGQFARDHRPEAGLVQAGATPTRHSLIAPEDREPQVGGALGETLDISLPS